MAGDAISLQAVAALYGAKQPPRIPADFDPVTARRVAVDFEAFFLSQALRPMFADIGAEKPFGGGLAEDMWRSLEIDEYGKAMARAGGIGIADAVFREMLRTQEVE